MDGSNLHAPIDETDGLCHLLAVTIPEQCARTRQRMYQAKAPQAELQESLKISRLVQFLFKKKSALTN
jgi:hypothetical protein